MVAFHKALSLRVMKEREKKSGRLGYIRPRSGSRSRNRLWIRELGLMLRASGFGCPSACLGCPSSWRFQGRDPDLGHAAGAGQFGSSFKTGSRDPRTKRWTTRLPSKVNFPCEIAFKAAGGINLVTLTSRNGGNATIVVHRVIPGVLKVP